MVYDPAELTEERRQALEAFAAGLALSTSRMELLNQSLTHRSYAFENPPTDDNERLEFLGDSVLGFVTADYFFQRYPGASEGDLSKRKAGCRSTAKRATFLSVSMPCAWTASALLQSAARC